MQYCSSFQSVVVYNFTEFESTFPVLFWDYLADCLWLLDMVSICLMRKGKKDCFLDEGLLLDWLIFLLYLLQFVCCSKYSAKTTNFLFWNLFLHFLHPAPLQHLRIFVTVINLISQPLSKSSQENFINFVMLVFSLNGLVCWRLTVSK